MQSLTIDARIREAAPGLVLGCVRASVTTAPGDDALWNVLQQAAAKAADEGVEPAKRPAIAALRDLYRRMGKDPSRYRGSPEALLRRALAGKPLYRISNVVDAINVVSLETMLPIGLYDTAKLSGPLVFRRGEDGETYRGIGKDELNLAGLPVLADDAGPFGSPTSDSERTCITLDAREVLAVVFGVTGRAELEPAAARTAELFRLHCGALEVETWFVT